ncbi:MAG: glycerate kinase, partial [Actinobacteria bacterium]
MHALASPASLKGVLSARDAAALLAEGFRRGGVEAKALPIADGGEGT